MTIHSFHQKTPLDIAIEEGYVKIVKYLREAQEVSIKTVLFGGLAVPS